MKQSSQERTKSSSEEENSELERGNKELQKEWGGSRGRVERSIEGEGFAKNKVSPKVSCRLCCNLGQVKLGKGSDLIKSRMRTDRQHRTVPY